MGATAPVATHVVTCFAHHLTTISADDATKKRHGKRQWIENCSPAAKSGENWGFWQGERPAGTRHAGGFFCTGRFVCGGMGGWRGRGGGTKPGKVFAPSSGVLLRGQLFRWRSKRSLRSRRGRESGSGRTNCIVLSSAPPQQRCPTTPASLPERARGRPKRSARQATCIRRSAAGSSCPGERPVRCGGRNSPPATFPRPCTMPTRIPMGWPDPLPEGPCNRSRPPRRAGSPQAAGAFVETGSSQAFFHPIGPAASISTGRGVPGRTFTSIHGPIVLRTCQQAAAAVPWRPMRRWAFNILAGVLLFLAAATAVAGVGTWWTQGGFEHGLAWVNWTADGWHGHTLCVGEGCIVLMSNDSVIPSIFISTDSIDPALRPSRGLHWRRSPLEDIPKPSDTFLQRRGFAVQHFAGPGLSQWILALPAWIVAAALALPPSLWVRRRWQDRERRRLGLCPECGYDLRAHVSGQLCPECGTTVPADLIRKPMA